MASAGMSSSPAAFPFHFVTIVPFHFVTIVLLISVFVGMSYLQVVIARWYARGISFIVLERILPISWTVSLLLCVFPVLLVCLLGSFFKPSLWPYIGTLLSSFLVRCFFSPILLVVSVVPFISLGASLCLSVCGFVVFLAYAFALLSGLCSDPLSFPSLHPVSSL